VKHIGITLASSGAAIVHVDHGPDEALLVTAIERLPFDLAAVANRVRQLDDEIAEVRFVVDGEGVGAALWTALGPPKDKRRWSLYGGHGVERQTLVNTLLVAVYEERFHFAPGLDEQAAMSKAIVTYRREVREDGVIGSELVVGLLLAVLPAPRVYVRKPRRAYGF
jgi:hypothetical protein